MLFILFSLEMRSPNFRRDPDSPEAFIVRVYFISLGMHPSGTAGSRSPGLIRPRHQYSWCMYSRSWKFATEGLRARGRGRSGEVANWRVRHPRPMLLSNTRLFAIPWQCATPLYSTSLSIYLRCTLGRAWPPGNRPYGARMYTCNNELRLPEHSRPRFLT